MDNNEVVTEEVAAVVENNTGIEIEPLFEEQVDFDTFSKSDFYHDTILNTTNLCKWTGFNLHNKKSFVSE